MTRKHKMLTNNDIDVDEKSSIIFLYVIVEKHINIDKVLVYIKKMHINRRII